jgi:diguanylate cyclase (GGDEF)-like protein
VRNLKAADTRDKPGPQSGPPESGPASRRESAIEVQNRILLVDDGRHGHAALERLAPAVRAVVHQARTATDALGQASKVAYDAIILDSAMAEEAPLLLEGLSALQTTTALLWSGDAPRFEEGSCPHSNLLGSFRKPWDDEELEAALRRAFTLTRARRAQPARLPLDRVMFERVMLVSSPVDGRRLERLLLDQVSPGGLVHATSLEAALTLLGQQAFDIVLTDLCLPDACGLDPIVRMRRINNQTPLIVLTSKDDRPLSDQLLQAGAEDVLLKPQLDGQSLLRAMTHARQRQRAQAHLHHGVLHDELTRLPRRTLLHQRIANALARSRRSGDTFAVIYLDIDHFKRINDTHGHDVGDAVLVAVSQRLEAAVREYDTVARLGGDEFAILLDSLDDVSEAELVAQRVQLSLAPPVRVARQKLEVTASMGISVFPAGGRDAEDLLRSADQAMYFAKRAGRNTYSILPLTHDSELPSPEAPVSALRSKLNR